MEQDLIAMLRTGPAAASSSRYFVAPNGAGPTRPRGISSTPDLADDGVATPLAADRSFARNTASRRARLPAHDQVRKVIAQATGVKIRSRNGLRSMRPMRPAKTKSQIFIAIPRFAFPVVDSHQFARQSPEALPAGNLPTTLKGPSACTSPKRRSTPRNIAC